VVYKYCRLLQIVIDYHRFLQIVSIKNNKKNNKEENNKEKNNKEKNNNKKVIIKK
jgi:hypothetical protein